MLLMILGTLLFNSFALFLLLLRPRLFRVKLFAPMIYNFKLSILPGFILISTLFLQLFLGWLSSTKKHDLFFILSVIITGIGLCIWFLMLPNSGYLVTELNLTHREVDSKEVPIWYDIISVLSLAISGVLNTALNIVMLQLIYLILIDPVDISQLNTVPFWLFTWFSFFLISFGIYLGRYIRFYSWDLLHPKSFYTKLISHFSIKKNCVNGILFTFFYGIFFSLIYVMTFLNPLLKLFLDKK